jgi:hypothetical protein
MVQFYSPDKAQNQYKSGSSHIASNFIKYHFYRLLSQYYSKYAGVFRST